MNKPWRTVKAGAKSWKTTALGVIGFIVILMPEVQAVLDNDPSTAFDAAVVGEAFFVLLLGLLAKDGDKKSEDVGL